MGTFWPCWCSNQISVLIVRLYMWKRNVNLVHQIFTCNPFPPGCQNSLESEMNWTKLFGSFLLKACITSFAFLIVNRLWVFLCSSEQLQCSPLCSLHFIGKSKDLWKGLYDIVACDSRGLDSMTSAVPANPMSLFSCDSCRACKLYWDCWHESHNANLFYYCLSISQHLDFLLSCCLCCHLN